MIENFWKRFDIWIIVPVFLLFSLGLLVLQSSAADSFFPLSDIVLKHCVFFAIGCAVLVLFAACDYDALGRLATPIALVNIFLLIFVFFAGHSAKGAQRWIAMGGFTFQPSEPAKLIVVLALAKILASVDKIDRPTIVSVVFTVFIPWFLIFIQPDLGTSLVIVFAAFVMLYFVGIKPWILLSVLLTASSLSPFLLRDYQKDRLLVFINPELDVSGAGWNIAQSKIAVGSGGLFGKGLFQGTQTQLDFVPEHSTDFIFSVIGEELGFIGCVLVLLLYVFLLYRCAFIIKSSKDKFGFLTGVGVFCLLGFHVFVNIGMVLGVMPVVGVPLTFISSGGSALISNMAAIGILESIYSRRERLFIK